jgi:acetylornithine/succinyldiaminopimelate/putrescine aminotransferase
MADYHCRTIGEALHDDRDIASKVRQRCAQHWSSALTYAAWLKTYGGKASSCNAARKVVEILGRAPQGGDHHNERPASLDQGLDRDVPTFKGLRSRRHETP